MFNPPIAIDGQQLLLKKERAVFLLVCVYLML